MKKDDKSFSDEKTGENKLTKRKENRVLVNFETFQKTRDLEAAEREQRIFNWEVETIIAYIEQDKLSDAEDLLLAYLGIKMYNKVIGDGRNGCDKLLKEIGNRGYAEAEQELRWRLQKHLRG